MEQQQIAPGWTKRPDRRAVELDGLAARATGGKFVVHLSNISYDGCQIKTQAVLEVGEQLRLIVPRLGEIHAQVQWTAEGRAGASFTLAGDAPQPVTDSVAEVSPRAIDSASHAPRRGVRVIANAKVGLRRAGGLNYRVQVYDCSPFGCRIEFVERPARAEVLWVKFDGLEGLEALVRWVEGFTMGVEFRKPLHVAVFELLKARLDVGNATRR